MFRPRPLVGGLRPGLAALLLIGVPFAGCADHALPPDAPAQTPSALEEAQPVTVHRDVVLRAPPGAPFGHITSGRFGPDGEAVLLDAMSDQVLRFDAQGAFVRAYGSKGPGPSELERPSGVAVTDSGLIVVADRMRLVSWWPDGRAGPERPFTRFLVTNGIFATHAGIAVVGATQAAPREVEVVSLSLNGGDERKLMSDVLPPMDPTQNIFDAVRGKETCIRCASAVGPDESMAIAGPDSSFVIHWASGDGQSRETIRRSLVPVRRTGAEMDSLRKRMGPIAVRVKVVIPE